MDEFARIHAAGVELEGGWETQPPTRMIGDGSIQLRSGTIGSNGRPINYVGEIPSPPFGSPREMFEWMANNYPHHTHQSCGMHLHTSFKSQNSYVRIMDKNFFDHVREELIRWGREKEVQNPYFFERLEGNNTYCHNTYNPMGQVRYKDKGPNRYSILNYCYGRYKTVELRALPLFATFDEAKAAITAYFEIVEGWLKRPPYGLKALHRYLNLEAEPAEKPSTKETVISLEDDVETRESTIRIRDEVSLRTVAV